MLEVNESKLDQYIVHYVGDSLILGDEAYIQPEVMLEAAFTQLAFNKVDFEQPYDFYHQTDLGLNEVFTYVNTIFDNKNSFLEQSKNIAVHLQSVSQHPNIKNGELFIGLFENCIWNTEAKRAISIVKIDEKEMYLDIKSEQEKVIVNGVDGINVKKINNIAVILDMGPDTPPAVFMKTKKKEDVVYWQERFLNIRVADEYFQKTSLALTECKKYIVKEESFTNTEKLGLLNKTLDYFRNEEAFEVDEYIETVFEKADQVQKDIIINSVKPFETVISESAIAKIEKNYKRKIKLDSNIEIQVNVRDIEQVEQLIEVGYDEVTNRKFYKIYFQEEL
ncbi:MAG: nucleoid-associated protein [Psychrobacillus sp.]